METKLVKSYSESQKISTFCVPLIVFVTVECGLEFLPSYVDTLNKPP